MSGVFGGKANKGFAVSPAEKKGSCDDPIIRDHSDAGAPKNGLFNVTNLGEGKVQIALTSNTAGYNKCQFTAYETFHKTFETVNCNENKSRNIICQLKADFINTYLFQNLTCTDASGRKLVYETDPDLRGCTMASSFTKIKLGDKTITSFSAR